MWSSPGPSRPWRCLHAVRVWGTSVGAMSGHGGACKQCLPFWASYLPPMQHSPAIHMHGRHGLSPRLTCDAHGRHGSPNVQRLEDQQLEEHVAQCHHKGAKGGACRGRGVGGGGALLLHLLEERMCALRQPPFGDTSAAHGYGLAEQRPPPPTLSWDSMGRAHHTSHSSCSPRPPCSVSSDMSHHTKSYRKV